ncbi:HEPN domain-containing protein [Acidobacteria bacterium AH-259-L09]|nr:HEPN domain-containing protein [Acidobacteria bacterium AH-259-L09]
MREEIRNLLEQAEEDLVTTRINTEHGRYYAAAFFAQQAAEKSLKALYLLKRREPIFTHDLSRIAERLGAPAEIREDAADLTPEYIIARYPNAANAVPAKLYTKRKAKASLERAERIMKWVKISLPSEGS